MSVTVRVRVTYSTAVAPDFLQVVGDAAVLPKVPPLLDVQARVRSATSSSDVRDKVAVSVTGWPPIRRVLSAETEIGGWGVFDE